MLRYSLFGTGSRTAETIANRLRRWAIEPLRRRIVPGLGAESPIGRRGAELILSLAPHASELIAAERGRVAGKDALAAQNHIFERAGARLLSLSVLLLVVLPLGAQQAPPRPHLRFRQVADKHYWLMVGGLFASAVFDVEATQRCLSRYPTCQESDPIFGPRPSRAHHYAIKLPITAGLAGTLYWYKYMKMRHETVGRWSRGKSLRIPPRWWQAGLIPIAAFTESGIHNLALRPRCPSGTTCQNF